MAFSTITPEQQAAIGVTGLPDTPELDTSAMQQKFDEKGDAAIDWIRTFVAELEADTAALDIGCSVPTGIQSSAAKLQSVINVIASLAKDASDKSHAHANKATLDAISSEVKSGYDALVSVLGTINALDTSELVPSETAIPTSYAVAQYILAVDISNKILQKVFPVGSVYIGPSSPATFVGGSWTQVNDVGISASYVAWKRTA
jgi:hypothetical protein